MKKKVLITGSAGLIGSESAKFFAQKNFEVHGIDNDMRQYFFGKEASTAWSRRQLKEQLREKYIHYAIDIRDKKKLEEIFKKNTFDLIIHTAAQPSHDWAAKEPITDFTVNALGTLYLLENYRKYSPNAVFIFTSTNKVYGDTPNKLPLVELDTRYELPSNHRYYNGIDETMSIDDTKHSIFGSSKVAADIMVQEYGKYFGLKTGVFRGGCLTGPAHSGTKLHGFLAYLVKCIATGTPYTIIGYKSKQVRDNIHSYDLVNMFWHFYNNPRSGEVYNTGGSRVSNISMTEAISKIEKLLGKKANINYIPTNRVGDHIWYISDVSKFKKHYPEWNYQYNINRIIDELCWLGHFASETKGSSTYTVFESPKNKLTNTIFLAAHTSDAYGSVQALRFYLASHKNRLISVEHSLAKVNNNMLLGLQDIQYNVSSFLKNKKTVNIFFAINPINALSAVILKLLGYRFKFIYYTTDYSSQRFKKNLVLSWLFYIVDYICVKTADYIWVTTPEILSIRRKQNIFEEKIILVRNGVKQVVIKYSETSEDKKRKYSFIIDGYLSKEKNVLFVLTAFVQLKKLFPQIILTIVLGNLNKNKLLTIIKSLKLTNIVYFIENVPHQLVMENYKDYGIGLGLMSINENDPAEFRDPTEIKAFLGAGIPVVCSQDFGISQEIQSNKAGISIKHDKKTIITAFTRLLSNEEEYDYYSKNATAFAKKFIWNDQFNMAIKNSDLIIKNHGII